MASKVSMHPKDAVVGTASFGEGWGLVTSAKSAVHQLPPNKESGNQEEPAVKVILDIQHTDEKGQSTGAEPITEYFKAAGVGKDGSFATTPGTAKSRTDADPKDMGAEIGTEGNCLVGAAPHANSKWMAFMKSVEQRGFKPEILVEGYLPDLEGMLAYFITEQKPGVNGGKPFSQLLVKEIKVYPYETAKKGASTATAKTNAAKPAAAKESPKPEPKSDEDPEEVALAVLQAVAAKNPGVTVEFGKMSSKTFMAFSKYSKDVKTAAKPFTENAEWIAAKSEELELGYAVTEDAITFPE